MEDLLPLLIGIIWLGYTLYNRGQKKGRAKMQQPVKKQERKGPSILEQILLGDVIPQPQPYGAAPAEEPSGNFFVEDTEPKPVSKKPSPFLSEELSKFTQEGQPGITVSDDDLTIKDGLKESLIKEHDFDLRKAVIFAEILNPPYIR
ncbi:MAG: hypothetical protein FJY07_00725 [Bacteroidetes bacterium]|nr:hypothetical protein [Bacteroidota bacterium]